MKNSIIFAAAAVLFSCQHTVTVTERDPAGEKSNKKMAKEYFKGVSKEERDDALARAWVFTEPYDPEKVAAVDIFVSQKQLCPGTYQFEKANVPDSSNDRFGRDD